MNKCKKCDGIYVYLSVSVLEFKDYKQMCVGACVRAYVEHQFFWAFSQAPLSLQECVCLSRLQPLSMCVCVIVSVCLRQTKRTRAREWVMRDCRGQGDRLRQRCYGSSSISSLLSGLWASQLSQSTDAAPSPELTIRYVRYRHMCFNSTLTPLAPRLSKRGLNKPQGCLPDKQTNMQRHPSFICRSLCLPRETEEPTLIVARHRERQREVDGRQEKVVWRVRGREDDMCEYVFIY